MTVDEYHILVAEDNRAMANVLRFNLERAGYRVTLAHTGRDALDLVATEQYTLIVTDQQMPELNGQQFCAEMRLVEGYSDTPVIMLTAKSLELDAERLRADLGIRRVFGKPFSPTEVVEAVGHCLAAAGPQPTAG